MITTRNVPRTRKLLIAAFLISVLLHLFGGALWERLDRALMTIMRAPHPQDQHERVDTITIQRAPATPKPIAVAKPQPVKQAERHMAAAPRAVAHIPTPVKPVTEPQPIKQAIAPVQPELSHIRIHAAKQYSKAGGTGRPEHAYSAAQLASLTNQFSKAIADSHKDLAEVNSEVKDAAGTPTMKHYSMSIDGLPGALTRGQGYIRPVRPGVVHNGTIEYYTHYEYMYPDGHIEEDDIPWPFYYPVNDDPFRRHQRLIPLQPPPPGYKPDRPLKPILMEFFGGPTVD